jgi:hypothetical protein
MKELFSDAELEEVRSSASKDQNIMALWVLFVNDSENNQSAGAKLILPHSCIHLVSLARCCAPAPAAGGRGDGPGTLVPRL